jgi:hypothetical protein
MSKRIRVAAAGFAVLMSANGVAGEAPSPRPPLGGAVRDMLPSKDPLTDGREGRGLTIPADRVRIRNAGNQIISLSYWDAQSWRTLTVAPGENLDVLCPQCGDAIPIAYHNGRENRTVQARPGKLYTISWSAQLGVWTLASTS